MLDFDKLRAEFEKLEKQNTGGDFVNNFFQVPEGDSTVRILPAAEEDQLFYAETKIHRIPTGQDQVKNVHCRDVHDEECPLCQAYRALWKPPYNNEDLGRQIKPRNRYYMNILDRESGEVKIWSVGIILLKKIMATMLDEDFADIDLLHLETGRDFKIKKIMEGGWPKYDQSAFRPKATAVGTKQATAEAMDSLHDIQALVRLEDYEECKLMAEGILLNGVAALERPKKEDKPTTDVEDTDYLERLKNQDA